MKPSDDIFTLSDAAVAVESRSAPSRLVDFYELTKPRMNFLVVITTMVGFWMAQPTGEMRWMLLLHAMLGTALCAACAAVLNQVMERDYDALMPRTHDRPIPTGRIGVAEATLLGASLGIIGVAYLAILVNPLTALLGFATIALYLLVYTPLKRRSTLNTVVGAVPGAIPPLMGFAAADGALSVQGVSLFAILFLWQMPHFLAIAILYRDDYRKGGFLMLPCVSDNATYRQMVLYSAALLPTSLLPSILGLAGAAYFTTSVLLGLAFMSFAVSCAVSRDRVDARKMFFASIVYLPLLLAAMMIDRV